MPEVKYLFPLSIQTVLPADYLQNAGFKAHLEALQNYGFYGVELNVEHPHQVDLPDVIRFLDTYDLKMTLLASGLTAKIHRLSLSSPEAEVRRRSIRMLQEMIDLVSGTDIGIIIGFLKGPPAQDRKQANRLFSESLEEIGPFAADKEVRLLIEATNRYETAVAHRLEEAVELIEPLENPFLRILPDTFHMNIEEADGFEALKKCAPYYDSIHISDNNRLFPGLGAIRFEELITLLIRENYSGSLAIEGNIQSDFCQDLTASMAYLKNILSPVFPEMPRSSTP
jgi:sugar phosphate isomerase/epimerase